MAALTLFQFQQKLAAGDGTPRFAQYVIDVTLTALQLLQNQRITVDANAWFVMQRTMTDQAASQFRFKFLDIQRGGYSSAGTSAAAGANDRVRNECLFGTGSLP